MKSRILVLSAFSLLGLSWAAPATSSAAYRTRRTDGASCIASTASNQPGLQTYYGTLYTLSTSATIEVICPLDFDTDSTLPRSNDNPTTISVSYYDANYNLGTPGDFRCRAEAMGVWNAWTETAYKYSCSMAGGCTASTNGSFIGRLNFGFPSVNLADGDVHGLAVRCELPRNIGYGYSQIGFVESTTSYN